MPLGNGWWVDSRTGKECKVYDHGKKEREAKVRAGWIRVREWKSERVFEADRLSENVLCTILEFATRHKWWDSDLIRLQAVSWPGNCRTTTIGKLRQEMGLVERV